MNRALWVTLVHALSGAMIVGGAIIAFIQGWLRFDLWPRLSTIVLFVGFVAFIYATLKLGRIIVLLGDLRSGRSK